MAAFVLSLEWVSSKYRVLSTTVVTIFYPIGEVILGLLAMYITSMRVLLLLIYVPALLVTFYYWLVPESIRWLVVTGQRERALNQLERTATANKRELSDVSKLVVSEKCANINNDPDSAKNIEKTIPLVNVFKSRILLLRLVYCSLCWIVVVHTFYGMSVSSTKIAADDNKYLSFIVVVFAEIPATIAVYYLSDRWGRRPTLCTGLIITGSVTIASAYVPLEYALITRALFFIGMFSISGAFSMLYIFTAEIWPTSMRNTLMNLCSMIGRLGGMAAPLTPLLVRVQ